MRVLTETKWGRMLVNDRDMYCGRMLLNWGEFSKGEVECFRYWIKPGMVVADVGANIGAHTLVFSRLVGSQGFVIAYEPQRLVFQMLCANLALNSIDNVFAYNQAVGKEHKLVMLQCLDQDAEQNFGGMELQHLEGGHEPCNIAPLPFDVDFMKVDVEGMELDVLEGAEEMIRRKRPILFIENEKEDRSAALLEKIRDLGYAAYWHVTPYFDEANDRGAKERDLYPEKHLLTMNLLCLPAERGIKLKLPVADCGPQEMLARARGEDKVAA